MCVKVCRMCEFAADNYDDETQHTSLWSIDNLHAFFSSIPFYNHTPVEIATMPYSNIHVDSFFFSFPCRSGLPSYKTHQNQIKSFQIHFDSTKFQQFGGVSRIDKEQHSQ